MPPDGADLLARARAKGVSDGRSGAYDQWSFDPARLPSYVSYLRQEREWAVAHAARSTVAEEEARHRAAESGLADLAASRDRVRRLRHEARDAAHQVMRARARIDRLATLEARRRERRLRYGLPQPVDDELTDPGRIWTDDAYRIEADVSGAAEWAGSASGAGGGPSAPDEATDDRAGVGLGADGTAVDAGGDTGSAGTAAPGQRGSWEHWEGPYTDRIPAWLTRGVLLALVLVELPIQWVIFDYFHGRNPEQTLLTTVFTVSVAVVMILAPHLAGRLYRGRYATGSSRLLAVVSLGLVVPSAVVLWVLGDLRRRVLLADRVTPDADGNTQRLPLRYEVLHLTPTTVSVMFIALLLITGGIAFLLGLARDHPWQVAYRDAELSRRFLHDELDRAMPVLRQAQQRARVGSRETTGGEDRRTAETTRLRAMYAAAELAYLDGVKDGLADPAAQPGAADLAGALRAEHADGVMSVLEAGT